MIEEVQRQGIAMSRHECFDDKPTLTIIQTAIAEAEKLIRHNLIEYVPISSSEFVAYFEGDAPSGDTITLTNVINNAWLVVHELIELSELKQMGLPINSELLSKNMDEVTEAHCTATEVELRLAALAGDDEWIENRLRDVQDWLEDSRLTTKTKMQYELILATHKPN